MVAAARAQFSLVSRILYRPSDRRCASNHFAAIRRHYRFHSHVLEAGPRGNMAVRAYAVWVIFASMLNGAILLLN